MPIDYSYSYVDKLASRNVRTSQSQCVRSQSQLRKDELQDMRVCASSCYELLHVSFIPAPSPPTADRAASSPTTCACASAPAPLQHAATGRERSGVLRGPLVALHRGRGCCVCCPACAARTRGARLPHLCL